MRIPAFLAGAAGLALAAPGFAQPAASPNVELTEERREVDPPELPAPVFPEHGAARGAKVSFEGGNAVGFEATFGHAFSLRSSYAYVELGIEAQIVSVDLSVHLDGTGYVGDTRLYSLAFAPVPRVGWFIPIDNDFYTDLTLDYRPTGLGGVGAGIGIGMSD